MKAIILTNGMGKVGMLPAVTALREGASPLDTVECGVSAAESDPAVSSVGLGGAPNLLGTMECDAGIMDGTTLNAGAVAALQGFMEAITVARAVMERLPHVLLAGEGAARFAIEMGLPPSNMLTDEARRKYLDWLDRHVPKDEQGSLQFVPLAELANKTTLSPEKKDTVIFLVRDAGGHFAAGASTSGWPYKYPGRVGDSPIIGAGLYADDQAGACACTHTGEMALRALTSRTVVDAMHRGQPLAEAVSTAIAELRRLRGGYIGPVVIHAMDREGNAQVTATHTDPNLVYWQWDTETGEIRSCRPSVETL